MIYKVQVIEVLECVKLRIDYRVVVRAKTEEGKLFKYTFIKNKKEDAEKIIEGYQFEMGCKPILY